MFAIFLLIFQQHHLSLDALLNKFFKSKEKNSNISQQSINLSSRFWRKNQSIEENENTKNKVRKSMKKYEKFKLWTLPSRSFFIVNFDSLKVKDLIKINSDESIVLT